MERVNSRVVVTLCLRDVRKQSQTLEVSIVAFEHSIHSTSRFVEVAFGKKVARLQERGVDGALGAAFGKGSFRSVSLSPNRTDGQQPSAHGERQGCQGAECKRDG